MLESVPAKKYGKEGWGRREERKGRVGRVGRDGAM